ncbi:MAG: diguanylate cyclase domain-containing protein [Candidatus Bipolaricaulia bacterium]
MGASGHLQDSFVKAMSQGDDLEELMGILLDRGIHLIPGAEFGALFLTAGEDFKCEAAVGLDFTGLRLPQMLILGALDLESGTVVERGTFQSLVDRLSKGAQRRFERTGIPVASILLPVRRHDQVIGYAWFGNITEELVFELTELEALFSAIELVIKWADDKRDLERRILTDPLTGLYNRRYFEKMIEKETARAKRSGAYFTSFLLIDIDQFQEIYNQLGQQVGDQVVQELARLLNGSLRSSDTAIHYQASEFLVMLPQAGIGQAKNVIVRLKQAVNRWNEQSVLDFPVTLSFGMASWSPEEERGIETALQEAKEQMGWEWTERE